MCEKTMAWLLIHPKTARMVLLKRIILQVDQNKEQTLFNRRKRAVLINDKTTPGIAVVAIHVVLGKIFVMSLREIRKQCPELFQAKARQRTKALFVILIIGIFHSAKINARTGYRKSNLH
jgi:hypothetical protein